MNNKKPVNVPGGPAVVFGRKNLAYQGKQKASSAPIAASSENIRNELAWEDEAITSTDDYYEVAKDKIEHMTKANQKYLDNIDQLHVHLKEVDKTLGAATVLSLQDDFSNHVYDSVDNVPARYLSSDREEEYNESLAAHLYSEESFEEFYESLDDAVKSPINVLNDNQNIPRDNSQIILSNVLDRLSNNNTQLMNDVVEKYVDENDYMFNFYDDNGEEIDLTDDNHVQMKEDLANHNKDIVFERISESMLENDDSSPVTRMYDREPEKAEEFDKSLQEEYKNTIRGTYDRYVKQVTGISNDD